MLQVREHASIWWCWVNNTAEKMGKFNWRYVGHFEVVQYSTLKLYSQARDMNCSSSCIVDDSCVIDDDEQRARIVQTFPRSLQTLMPHLHNSNIYIIASSSISVQVCSLIESLKGSSVKTIENCLEISRKLSSRKRWYWARLEFSFCSSLLAVTHSSLHHPLTFICIIIQWIFAAIKEKKAEDERQGCLRLLMYSCFDRLVIKFLSSHSFLLSFSMSSMTS